MNSELIFPIKDAASAALMIIKADCLHNAGVISEGERQWVYSRARAFLDDATQKDAAFDPHGGRAFIPSRAPNYSPATSLDVRT